MIEVLTTAPLNSVQDLGRPGLLDMGVSRCGAMDRHALGIGNALLCNDPGDAAIEVVLFPFRLRFRADTAFAVTGAYGTTTLDGERIAPNWVRTANSGQELVLGARERGARSYICLQGGIDVPKILGSRATDQKSGFGGLEGRGLRRGDILPLLAAKRSAAGFATGYGAASGYPPIDATIALRVLPAAEFDDFTEDARDTFFGIDWLVTRDSNRIGYRLSGTSLALKRPLELFSHGILPGTVQVPPSGQPMIQLADANTCGGYPKIANVIEADLWMLGQAPVGARLRFAQTDRNNAVASLRQQADAMADLRAVSALLAKAI